MASPKLQKHILNEHNLQPLLHFVEQAAAKWRQIGIALKFGINVLDAIAMTPGNATPIDCLTDLLSRWLRWAPPNHDLPTLESLAEAFRGGTVGEERMAFDLMQEFQETQTSHLPEDQQCHTTPELTVKYTAVPHMRRKLRRPRGLAVRGEQICVVDKGGDDHNHSCIKSNARVGHDEYSTNILTDPYGIAIDAGGNIYATDCASHRLYKFDEKLEPMKILGDPKGGWNNDEFYYPHGVEIINDMVFVCDNGSGRVKVFDLELNHQYSFGDSMVEPYSDDRQLYGPVDIAVDSQSALYVTDNKRMAIAKFCAKGAFPEFSQIIAHGKLQMPAGITVDSNDLIFVTDKRKKCILIFNSSGELLKEFTIGPMIAPRGIRYVKTEADFSIFYISDVNYSVNVWKCSIQYK